MLRALVTSDLVSNYHPLPGWFYYVSYNQGAATCPDYCSVWTAVHTSVHTVQHCTVAPLLLVANSKKRKLIF